MSHAELRKAIATDIYHAAQHAPMTLTADGGQLASVLAELAIRRVEEVVGNADQCLFCGSDRSSS